MQEERLESFGRLRSHQCLSMSSCPAGRLRRGHFILALAKILIRFLGSSGSLGVISLQDLSAGRPQYPPDFGPPPKARSFKSLRFRGFYLKASLQTPRKAPQKSQAQTRDLRPLPFGYGFGSGTMAKWLTKKAKASLRGTDKKT